MMKFYTSRMLSSIPSVRAKCISVLKLLTASLLFVGLNFRYQALKAYFCVVVCPEHVIIVAYYKLFQCPDFHGLISF